jgi:5-methylcytosine-specific restriction endonuclease McrA
VSRATASDRSGREVQWESPDGARECAYCGRPFTDETLLALHRGHTHPGELSAAERMAFEDAYEAEEREIREFRLKAIGLLVVLYFGFLVVYAVI